MTSGMKLLKYVFLLALAVPALWLAVPQTGHAGGGNLVKNLVPHRAVYDIRMVSKASSSQLLNISGQMIFEWKPGCEAWTTAHRFTLLYEYADTQPMKISSDFSTYETYDGRNLNFTSRRERNGELYEELRGNAVLDRKGAGKGIYSLPEGLTFDLAPETLFPMSHTLQLLEHMRSGKKFFHATVFDGSDTEGPVEINAFIGKRESAPAELMNSSRIDKNLIAAPAAAIRMAFFPTAAEEPESDYEMSALLHDNGIISSMKVDYKDFSVIQKLAALEKIEPENCGKSKKNKP